MRRGIVVIKIGQLGGIDDSGDLCGVGFTRVEIIAADRKRPVSTIKWNVKTHRCDDVEIILEPLIQHGYDIWAKNGGGGV